MANPHPKDAIGKDLVQPGTFSTATNPNQPDRSLQETELVTASQGYALGSNGETQAVAKKMRTNFSSQEDSNLKGNSALLFENYSQKQPDGSKRPDLSFYHNGDLGGDRGLITRQVATYKVDQFLGLNNVAEEKYGRDANGQVYGMSILADGEGISGKRGMLTADFKDPRVQRGLSDLEVSDYITGQIDRNTRNIFVDPATGKVTGIDNDLGFPEVSRTEALRRDPAFQDRNVPGMPKVMHEETAQKLLATKPEDLRTMLKNMPGPPPPDGPQKLSEKAIDGAVDRLKEVQAELKKGKNSSIQVVSAFNDTTYQNSVQAQVSAYEGQSNAKPWNQLGGKQQNDDAFTALVRAPRTSYLGCVMIDAQVNRFLGDLSHSHAPKTPKLPNFDQIKKRADAYDKLSPEAQKFLDTTPSRLDAQLDSVASMKPGELKNFDRQTVARAGVFNQLSPETQKVLAADPSKLDARLDNVASMTPKQQRDFNKQMTKLQKGMTSDLEHVRHPSGLDRLKALGSGGMEHLKDEKRFHAIDLKSRIDKLSASLDGPTQQPTVKQKPPQPTDTQAPPQLQATINQGNSLPQQEPQQKPRQTQGRIRKTDAGAKPRELDSPPVGNKPTFPKVSDMPKQEEAQMKEDEARIGARAKPRRRADSPPDSNQSTFPKVEDLQKENNKTGNTPKVPTVEEALEAEKTNHRVRKPKVGGTTTVEQEVPGLGEGLKTSRSKRSISLH